MSSSSMLTTAHCSALVWMSSSSDRIASDMVHDNDCTTNRKCMRTRSNISPRKRHREQYIPKSAGTVGTTRNHLGVSRSTAERRPIWTVVPQVGEESEEDVDSSEEVYQTENDTPGRAVDREEEVDETGEERENGYVEQCRYGLYGLRKRECLHAFEKAYGRACTAWFGLGPVAGITVPIAALTLLLGCTSN
jgi:hypothetical protein